MSTPTPTFGQTLLALIENEAVLSFGPALITFFQQVQAANGDKVKEATAWIQLQGGLIGAAPNALGGLESQLAGIILAKLQALEAKAATPAA